MKDYIGGDTGERPPGDKREELKPGEQPVKVDDLREFEAVKKLSSYDKELKKAKKGEESMWAKLLKRRKAKG